MSKTLTRQEAIAILSGRDLAALSAAERQEQLECMLHENWRGAPGWKEIAREVREELEEKMNTLAAPATDPRYDAVLLMWLLQEYAPAKNDWLLEQLLAAGHDVAEVTGTPAQREACPCCGLRTLGQRNMYAICPVCWWEDDGQDNADADIVMGGPNDRWSLTEARANYLHHGIACPDRTDLRAYQQPAAKYEAGRVFELGPGGSIRER